MAVKKKKSLRERLAEKRRKLKERGNNNFVLRQKDEGTIRVRILPVGDDEEFVYEVITFWLGKDLGLVYSPATFGEPCALMETYEELKNSDDEDDRDLAKTLIPKTKYITPVVWYKDLKGKVVDEEKSNKPFLLPSSAYQEVLDLYLDEDEWGDMTDPKNGYDIKVNRTGTGFTDTSYSVTACKNTPLPKSYRKVKVDMEKLVRDLVASYEETVEKRDAFLGIKTSKDSKIKKKKKALKKKRKSKRK